MAYLDAHPNPNLPQQRPRRDQPSGVIVVHTAESALDVTGEDTGAEGVARFISERTSYGSYHRVADSDSVVDVARFEMTTYGDGTGSNDHAIHLSFACRAADWPNMSTDRKAAFITNGARAAADAAAWLEREHGTTLPARRITRAQSDQRVPGFISHGERDPGRRTDPGPAFPWDLFLDTYTQLTQEDPMADYAAQLDRLEEHAELARKRDRQNRQANRKIARAQARQLEAVTEALIAQDEKTRAAVRRTTNEVLEAIAAADADDQDDGES